MRNKAEFFSDAMYLLKIASDALCVARSISRSKPDSIPAEVRVDQVHAIIDGIQGAVEALEGHIRGASEERDDFPSAYEVGFSDGWRNSLRALKGRMSSVSMSSGPIGDDVLRRLMNETRAHIEAAAEAAEPAPSDAAAAKVESESRMGEFL